MVNIPRQCLDCQQVYWSDYFFPNHSCRTNKQVTITFDHYKPREPKPPKPQKPKFTHTCKVCEQKFTNGHKHRLYCTESCRMKGENKNKIAAANERWLENKPRKKSKYSFAQINRMAEWKRLYDDESLTKRFNARRM